MSSTAIVKIYPSSLTFMKGRLVYAEYSSSCLRKVLLSMHGIKEPFPEHLRDAGAANEESYETTLKKAQTPYERELPVTMVIAPGVLLSGRIDFLIDSSRIVELKRVTSSSSWSKLKAAGAPRLANVAQIVSYMLAKELDSATLAYSYNSRGKEHEIHFSITIDLQGRILVDGQDFGFEVENILKFMQTAADNYNNGVVWDRPLNWDSKFASPCTYCHFKTACDSYDNGLLEGVDAFLADSKQAIKEK